VRAPAAHNRAFSRAPGVRPLRPLAAAPRASPQIAGAVIVVATVMLFQTAGRKR
jgi:hypothetical protein